MSTSETSKGPQTPGEARPSTAGAPLRTGAFPPVAVVTPVYNGEPYIGPALESVQRQTYPNLVHVVLDNACTDGTADTIARLQNGRVPILTRRNPEPLPQTPNWNAAFRLVPEGTKYVVLLCADDLLRADAVEKMVARAEEDDAIAYVTAGDVVGDWVLLPRPPGGQLIVDGDEVVRAFCAGQHAHIQWACFLMRWRPDLGDGRDDLFDPASSSDDVELGLRLMRRGKVGFCLDTLSWTRQHANNVTSQSLKVNARFRMSHWEACLAHCHAVFDKPEADRWLREAKYNLLRWQTIYVLGRKPASAKYIADQLTADGHRPRALEYPVALLSYLPYKLRQRAIAASTPQPETQTITEAEFVAWSSADEPRPAAVNA